MPLPPFLQRFTTNMRIPQRKQRFQEEMNPTSITSLPTQEDWYWGRLATGDEEDLYWRRLSDN